MKIRAQRQSFAACVALAVVACGGNATTSRAGAGSVRTSPNSSGGAQTAPSIEVGSAAAGAADAAGTRLDTGAGGSVSDAGGEAAEAGTSANGGADTAASAGAAGEAASGGAVDGGVTAGGAPNVMKPSGGTHFCEGAEDCSDTLECRGRGSAPLQVCLARCAVDADCAVSHRCVMPSDPLGPDEPACFLRCDDSPLVCPYAFDCYDISGDRDYTCLPRQW